MFSVLIHYYAIYITPFLCSLPYDYIIKIYISGKKTRHQHKYTKKKNDYNYHNLTMIYNFDVTHFFIEL